MNFFPGHTYHIYNQGNNKEEIFFDRHDYLLFVKKMKKALKPHSAILAWCLMPTHFHWLVRVNDDYKLNHLINERITKPNALNNNIGTMLSSYTQSVNQKNKRTGSLFRKRTKAKPLDEDGKNRTDYGINCFLYIHQNPLRAGLVSNLGEWEFSSYQDYAGIRDGILCEKVLARDLFNLPMKPEDFKMMSIRTIPEGVVQNLF